MVPKIRRGKVIKVKGKAGVVDQLREGRGETTLPSDLGQNSVE